jgi:hypothetical protein
MQVKGIVIHHSSCPSINGKGYDFFITKNGTIIPALEPTEAQYIHICLEGDFSKSINSFSLELREMMFILSKLVIRLATVNGFHPENIVPHSESCPAAYFPWSQLVISPKDEYH